MSDVFYTKKTGWTKAGIEEQERRSDLTKRLEQCEAALPSIRARISDCLKGEVFSQNQWTKGYCAGIVAALTAFDDAARAALGAALEK